MLTIAASLVGWYSFDRVGDVQSRVNEGTVPALAAAFEVARYSGELVAAGPRLASAVSTEGFVSVEAGIDAAHGEFREQLNTLEQSDALEQSGAGVGDLELMRNHADDLIEILDSISDDKPVLLALAGSRVALGSDLERLQQRLDDIVILAIDDQLFTPRRGTASWVSRRPVNLNVCLRMSSTASAIFLSCKRTGISPCSCWAARSTCRAPPTSSRCGSNSSPREGGSNAVWQR